MESGERGSAGVRSPLSSEAAWSHVVRGAPAESGAFFKYLDLSRRYKGARGPCAFLRPGLQRRAESGFILDGLGAPRCTSCWPRFLWHLYTCIQIQLLLLQQDRECGEWSVKGQRKEPLSVRLPDTGLSSVTMWLLGEHHGAFSLLRPQAGF